MTSPPDLFKTLTSAGISASDAKVLADIFPTEPDFLDGLEQIAQVLANLTPLSMIPPSGNPWKTIHLEMGQAKDPQSGYVAAVNTYPPDVQFAIGNVITPRVNTLMQQAASKIKRKTADYIRTLNVLGYHFKLNLCTDDIMVNGAMISDTTAAQIRNAMKDAGFTVVSRIEDAYMEDAYKHRYHPVRDYLNSLKYDGGQYIARLSSYFTDKHNFFPIAIKRFLIGSVAKTMQGAFNPMLVLEGPQDIGKSFFTRWLCSPMPEYWIEGPINTEDKDTWKRLMYKWIWEVSELGSTIRRSDVEALKAFISQQEVIVRKAYGHYDTQKPALANLIGTINNMGGFLTDPTGNRRFLPVAVTHIDWQGYTKDLRVDDIWSEAYALYLMGETCNLTPDENKQANTIREEYEIDDPVEGILKQYYQIDLTMVDDKDWMTPSADIIQTLEDPTMGAYKGNTRATAMALSATMTKLKLPKKWIQVKVTRGSSVGIRQQVRGYGGIRKIV